MKNFRGFKHLKTKTASTIIAALATIQNMGAKSPMAFDFETNTDKIDTVGNNKLVPKLVLKLNMADPSAHVASMHASHSSHRSHSSHSSHSSHYSSSSSGSYSPSYYTPSTYTPSTYTAPSTYKPKAAHISTPSSSGTRSYSGYSSNDSSTLYFLGERTLYKGLQGNDVEELQKKLLSLGYDVVVTAYFGDKTDKAVKNFQLENELKPDGIVGTNTLESILSKL